MEMHDNKELKVGDKVRTEAGAEGELAVLNSDGVTTYVQIDEGRGATFTLCRLDALTKIAEK